MKGTRHDDSPLCSSATHIRINTMQTEWNAARKKGSKVSQNGCVITPKHEALNTLTKLRLSTKGFSNQKTRGPQRTPKAALERHRRPRASYSQPQPHDNRTVLRCCSGSKRSNHLLRGNCGGCSGQRRHIGKISRGGNIYLVKWWKQGEISACKSTGTLITLQLNAL